MARSWAEAQIAPLLRHCADTRGAASADMRVDSAPRARWGTTAHPGTSDAMYQAFGATPDRRGVIPGVAITKLRAAAIG